MTIRHAAHTGTMSRRVVALTGTTPGLSPSDGHARPEALRSSEVVLSSPSSLLRPQPPVSTPSRRLPVSRLYAGPSPYGRVLADVETFPALRHRSFPWCHRPYAGEPCGCTRPIASPQTLAFALLRQARRSQLPQLALSTPQRGLLVGHGNDAAAIRLMLRPQGLFAPLDQPTSTSKSRGRRVLVLPGFHAQGSPPGRAGYDYLGTSDNSQGGTLTRWIDAVTGCNGGTV